MMSNDSNNNNNNNNNNDAPRIILIGERHDNDAAKTYVLENLEKWKSQGFTILAIELAHDMPVGDIFDKKLPEEAPFQSALDSAHKTKDEKILSELKNNISNVTQKGAKLFGAMIVEALKLGFRIEAVDDLYSLDRKRSKKRVEIMDKRASARILEVGPKESWIAVVGAEHLTGMKKLLEEAGFQVETINLKGN